MRDTCTLEVSRVKKKKKPISIKSFVISNGSIIFNNLKKNVCVLMSIHTSEVNTC
jgi:hypothetical protein